ncbi:MAG: MBL fold metallo-hydrolase [Clostridia bacterium]|nr:MBL fold metallo-hydrolase [Clostridia bacterium]
MALKIAILGSGSKGNCSLLSDGRTSILIDAGLAPTAIVKRLSDFGLDLSDIDGLLLTHEHDDHIRAVEQIAPFLHVYSHPDTLDAVEKRQRVPLHSRMEIGEEEFSIGTLDIRPFRVSHDAAHPFGFSVKDFETKVTYMTDTGYVSKGMLSVAKGSDLVVLESNHDKDLLTRGVYPYYLKRRILSDQGHLSNEESALAAYDLIESGAKRIVLAHLSEQNNLPELAYWTTENYLSSKGVTSSDCALEVAKQWSTTFVDLSK